MDFELRMHLLNDLVLKFFIKTNKDLAKPKDIMPYLIAEGFYQNDYSEGLPLRNDLRKLDKKNRLDILETLEVVRGKKNRSWTFVNPKALR